MREDDGPPSESAEPTPTESEDASPGGTTPPDETSPSEATPPGDDTVAARSDPLTPTELAETDTEPSVGSGAASDGEPPERPLTQSATESDSPGLKEYVFDLVSSVAIVVVIGGLLFAASGVWPPMVAVESGSMEPVMEKGDLVFVMEADRFPGEGAEPTTGVVTHRAGQGTDYSKFGDYGDVIVYQPNGNSQQTPIIHRAMFWVGEDENWVAQANPAYLGGIDSCAEAPQCPTNYAGFITKGDANGQYDQVNPAGLSRPVKGNWVIGTAEHYLPYLGRIRLGWG